MAGIRIRAALIALGIGVVVLSSCTEPGKGARAEAGYSTARPVIAALKRYHEQHAEYPSRLRDLLPNDLAQDAWKTPEGKPVDEFLEYEKSGTSYQLRFRYTGP